jgi:DNA-binding transcriptional MerR regulator
MDARTWTAKEVAEAFDVSPRTLKRWAKRIAAQLGPARYGRNGRHWRKHRLYSEREILLLKSSRETPS